MRCPNCWNLIKEPEAPFCSSCGVHIPSWSGFSLPPDSAENTIVLNKTPITIGRGQDNDVRLDHPAVSEHHARLEWRPETGFWNLVDEQSARGTFINYRRVPQGLEGWPVDLTVDIIWIAPYSFRLAGGEQQQPLFDPASLRVDARELVRTVRHEKSGQPVAILDLEATPLSFRSGEFIALVGGSGAGKSTLMKALLGLSPAQEGIVYISGRPFIQDGKAERFEAMHTIVGYVPQDDVVHRDLCPLEAMDYIAQFRLSPDLSRDERSRYIQKTLETVELWPYRDRPICKLSGGQRKRVNIALELLAQPRLLFLDEPTSGLDPGLDLSVMELLQNWAADPSDPRTIVLVTHATENVTQCKYVAFMAAGGHVVYFGPPAKALEFFGVDRFAEIYRTIGVYQPFCERETANGNTPAGPDVRELVDRFNSSPDYFQYVQSRQLVEEFASDPIETRQSQPRHSLLLTPVERDRLWRQFKILATRYWKLIRRDRMNFITLLLQGLLVAGLLWAVSGTDTFQPKGAEDAQTVLFIMACAAAWLGILNGTKEIVKEQDIFQRERRYGLAAAPYVLSKLVVLAIIGAIQIGTMLLVIGRHLVIPESGALGVWSPAWLEWFISLELTLVAGLALGLFLSASAATIDAATAVMFVVLLIQVMFAGLFFPDAQWADLLSVLTFSRWGLEGVGTTANLNGLMAQAVGNVYRADEAYTFTVFHLLVRWIVLFAYILLFTGLAIFRQARK